MKGFIVGLTGRSGSGKSTVSKYFEKMGFGVIDCDKTSRSVTEIGSKCLEEIYAEFGKDVLNGDGSLNRRALGAIVFSDKVALGRLNSIIFPYITEKIERQCSLLHLKGYDIIVLDAPTLFESGAYRFCDAVVAVVADEQDMIRRIQKRDSVTATQAKQRLESQIPQRDLRFRSSFVIENRGNEAELEVKAERAVKYIREMKNEKGS